MKFLGSLNQQILKDLAAHASVDDRVPVHKLDRTGGQCLGQLIHGCRSLLRTRTRNSCEISNTLDRIHRRLQIDTGSCKRTDVPCHFGEIINSLIGVGIELIQSSIDLSEVGSLALGVGKNGLNRVQLSLILFETATNAISQITGKLHTIRSRFGRKITHGNNADGLKSLEMRLNCIKLLADRCGLESIHTVHQGIPHRRDSHFDVFNTLLNWTQIDTIGRIIDTVNRVDSLLNANSIGANLSDRRVCFGGRLLHLIGHLVRSGCDTGQIDVIGSGANLLNALLSA